MAFYMPWPQQRRRRIEESARRRWLPLSEGSEAQILDARRLDQRQSVEEIRPFRRRADGERRAERRGDHLQTGWSIPPTTCRTKILDQGDVEGRACR